MDQAKQYSTLLPGVRRMQRVRGASALCVWVSDARFVCSTFYIIILLYYLILLIYKHFFYITTNVTSQNHSYRFKQSMFL